MVKVSFLVLTLLLFAVYAIGTSKVVFGGDSGDIILSYYFAGVAHPPGYPLNTLLGVILTHLMPFGTFAFRANLISAIYMAISVSLIFILFSRLVKNYLISVSAALVLAFVPLFWLYAHVAEVFQLTLVLTLASLLALFDYWQKPDRAKSRLYLAVFFYGLAVFHHQTAIFLAPAYVFAFIKTGFFKFGSVSKLFKLFAVFLLGAVPYVYVFWAAWRKTPINWNDPANLAGFWQLITRSEYGTFTAAPALVGFSPMARLVQVYWYLKVVFFDFTYLGVLLLILGGVWLFAKARNWFWFLALGAFFSGPFFLAYASFPPLNDLLLGVIERFLLLNYLFLATFVCFGMYAIFIKSCDWAKKYYFGFWRFSKLFIPAAFLLFPLYLFLSNWPRTDLSSSQLGSVFGSDIMTAADLPGIIFLQGDTSSFNTQYSYYVDGVGRDAKIILTGRLRHQSYREQIRKYYPELVFGDGFFSPETSSKAAVDLVERNFSTTAVYSLYEFAVPDEYVFVQQGMLKRLYRRESLPSDDEIVSRALKSLSNLRFNNSFIEGRYRHFFDGNIISIYASVFAENAFELLRHGAPEKAKDYFETALSLSPDNTPARFGLGVYYFEKKDCTSAQSLFEEIVLKNSSYWQAWEGLGQVWQNCFFEQKKAREFFDRSQLERNKSLSKPVEEL